MVVVFFPFFFSNLAILLGFKAISGNRCVSVIKLRCHIRYFFMALYKFYVKRHFRPEGQMREVSISNYNR